MKIKALYILILFLFCINNSNAQLWYITRGLVTDEVAWGVDVDNAGNIYWTVEQKDQWPYWYYNIYLYKISPDGQEIWQANQYGGDFNEIAFTTIVKDN